MILEMPGQLSRLKSRKRKTGSDVEMPRKASATRGRSAKKPKMSSASAESCPEGGGQEGHARISCECQQAAERRRCSASPEPEGREGKENKEWDGCGAKGSLDKEQPECEESRGPVFPDDDSNQILPVEQFFGNMDIVQDFPPREPKGSGHTQRESRRRHFYAREDSDDEADVQRQDGGDT